jgi:endoglucanase
MTYALRALTAAAVLLTACAPSRTERSAEPPAAPSTTPSVEPAAGPGAEAGAGPAGDSAAASLPAGMRFIRVNQVGYLPGGPKVAVVCSLEPESIPDFSVVGEDGRVVLGPEPARRDGAFGPCAATHRLDFGTLRRPGRYRIVAGGVESRPFRIAADAYAGAADTLLMYMRQQRSGFNPLFGDSVHHRTDGILVDHARAGEFLPVAGGWHDAADYLQYVTTSATATYSLLAAYRDHAAAFGDRHRADGTEGSNGVADVLDEARHGLEWLVAMFPGDGLLLNQVADDRDHLTWSLPTTDSADYGWGKGGPRPVYPCTGRPQGLFDHRNRSDGLASTAGKMASAMALGAALLRETDPAFADTLERKAEEAYALGRANPGVCQTAPARAPYFYEEASWADDMELAAAQLHSLTRQDRYLGEAVEYARMEPVTPWMGRDTARHYEFYPWHNYGHYQIWRAGAADQRAEMAGFYREGLERVAARADNGFRVGIPFIWCSNDLMVSFATQAHLYRRMTGDTAFRAHEQAAIDWIFGVNPWGASMVVGYPADGNHTDDPHSIVARELGAWTQTGGLLDGPVYRSIYESLLHIRLYEPDRYARLNTGHVVYHDDFGDYSTNEPIMDGTANLVYMAAALADPTGDLGDGASREPPARTRLFRPRPRP